MTASNRMYLKAIGQLSQWDESVRIADIAGLLGVSKASASVGVKKLCNMSLVMHALYGDVQMTEAGTAKMKAMLCADDLIRMRIQNAQKEQGTMGLV